MLAKNKMKCLLCLSNIPRQRNLRRLESVNYPRLVEVQVLDNDIVAFDLQNVKRLPPGANSLKERPVGAQGLNGRGGYGNACERTPES